MKRSAAAALVATVVLAACGSSAAPAQLAGLPSGPSSTATPLAVEQPSETPTAEEPTDTPTSSAEEPTVEPASAQPADTPAPAALGVSVTKVTKTVQAGGKASVTIATKKGANCSITVEYNSGPSTAKGLGDKTADSTGKVSWTWTVGSHTSTGTYPITISCNSGDLYGTTSTEFTVT